MTHSNRNRAASGRIARRAIFAACLFGALQSPLLADAKTDGERGIEAYQQGRLIEAMGLLERAAQGGYAPAQVLLAYIQDAAENDTAAFEWYRRAAEAGDAAGIYGLGSMYAKGEGVERDPVEAGRLIRRAAEMDHLPAIRTYAHALEDGSLGFASDPAAAVEWFRLAAEAGDAVAMHRLRDAYTEGQLGLPVDPEQAAQWDEKIMQDK